jgi:hypothetical protein
LLAFTLIALCDYTSASSSPLTALAFSGTRGCVPTFDTAENDRVLFRLVDDGFNDAILVVVSRR